MLVSAYLIVGQKALFTGRLVLGPAGDSTERRVPLPERFDFGMGTVITAQSSPACPRSTCPAR
jgi:hypothetical protein